jgi:predicted dehydrogenase
MERVAVGFVGAGAVATRHAATLARFEDVDVVGVADPDAGAAGRLAARAGANAYASHEELLARERLDALYVCVPPFAHGAPELAAVEAGLPLFVEKPLAADLATAELIAEAVRGRGLVTGVGYHWRWLDTVERARELLDGNPARLVLAYWLDKVPPPAWWRSRDRSGGQVVEQATHVLDLARALVGEVTLVHAVGARSPRADFPDSDVDDVSAASLRFSTGAVGTVAATCLLGRLHRAGIHLFADGLALELSEAELVVGRDGGEEVHTANGDARGRPDRDFVDAVKGGPDRMRVPYAEALRTHRLACALAASAVDGRVVELALEASEPAPGPAPGPAPDPPGDPAGEDVNA